MVTVSIVNEVVPVLVIVTVCGELVVPSGWLRKAKEVALSDDTAVVLVPVPFSVTVWGAAVS